MTSPLPLTDTVPVLPVRVKARPRPCALEDEPAPAEPSVKKTRSTVASVCLPDSATHSHTSTASVIGVDPACYELPRRDADEAPDVLSGVQPWIAGLVRACGAQERLALLRCNSTFRDIVLNRAARVYVNISAADLECARAAVRRAIVNRVEQCGITLRAAADCPADALLACVEYAGGRVEAVEATHPSCVSKLMPLPVEQTWVSKLIEVCGAHLTAVSFIIESTETLETMITLIRDHAPRVTRLDVHIHAPRHALPGDVFIYLKPLTRLPSRVRRLGIFGNTCQHTPRAHIRDCDGCFIRALPHLRNFTVQNLILEPAFYRALPQALTSVCFINVAGERPVPGDFSHCSALTDLTLSCTPAHMGSMILPAKVAHLRVLIHRAESLPQLTAHLAAQRTVIEVLKIDARGISVPTFEAPSFCDWIACLVPAIAKQAIIYMRPEDRVTWYRWRPARPDVHLTITTV